MQKSSGPASPLTDLEAALLVAMSEATQYEFSLNQRQLASFVHSDPQTVSASISDLARREFCVVAKLSGKGRRNNFPTLTEQGRQALFQYAQIKFGDLEQFLETLADLPEYRRTVRAAERLLNVYLHSALSKISPETNRRT